MKLVKRYRLAAKNISDKRRQRRRQRQFGDRAVGCWNDQESGAKNYQRARNYKR